MQSAPALTPKRCAKTLRESPKESQMPPTTPPAKTLPEEPSKRLGEALLKLTPEQREEAMRIAAKLLAIKAKKFR